MKDTTEFYREYISGISIKQLSKKYSLSQDFFRIIFLKNGFKLKTRSQAIKDTIKIIDEDEICKRYLNGDSKRKLVRDYKTSFERIKAIFQKKGIPERDRKLSIQLANPKRKLSPVKGMESKMWKGDLVGYFRLHDWIRKNKINPNCCELCGATNRKLQLANIDGFYRRKLEDYLWLCVPCHYRFDDKGAKISNALTKKLDVNKIKEYRASGFSALKIGILMGASEMTIFRRVKNINLN